MALSMAASAAAAGKPLPLTTASVEWKGSCWARGTCTSTPAARTRASTSPTRRCIARCDGASSSTMIDWWSTKAESASLSWLEPSAPPSMRHVGRSKLTLSVGHAIERSTDEMTPRSVAV